MTYRLSICIPTRNRAQTLERALASITACPAFAAHGDIEVVVSDNASTDDTPAVVGRFVQAFGDRIRYFRNESDLVDRNFEVALRHGRGQYLKLANDSLEWSGEGLAHMHELVGACAKLKPAVFFLNGARPTPEPVLVLHNPDELLAVMSFQVTWIGSFGIWREQLEQMPDFSRRSDLHLVQVDATFRLATQDRPVVVSNIQFARGMDVGRKGGYDLARVFGVNYLSILASFEGRVSPKALAREKQSVLVDHILPWYFNTGHDFGQFPLESSLDPVYQAEPYYQEALAAARTRGLAQQRAAADPQQIVQAWRARNAHNETYMVRLFDPQRVTVGKASYGPLDVQAWGHPDERLSIGHYVSIAEGVSFLLGGNHPYKGFSTYPFKVKLLGHAREAQTKGPIVVGDDVWIGANAMILSGVTIGQGAVIGAGAVVSSDVPPYAIVAGNPARVVRYRFAPAVIARLMTLDFGRLQPQRLAQVGEDLYEEITEANVDAVLARLQPEAGHVGVAPASSPLTA